jgi:hypothetical protein
VHALNHPEHGLVVTLELPLDGLPRQLAETARATSRS